jgi:hypothetical protein
MGRAENVILESNSVLRFLKPDLYLAVLDPGIADFKRSALRYLDRADALLLSGSAGQPPTWASVSPSLVANARAFQIEAPAYWSEELEQYVQARLSELKKRNAVAAS